jgi:hypothetical protein
MKLNDKQVFWSNIIFWIAVFIVLCFLLLSCSVLKKSSSKKDDFTNLSKSNLSTQDSGRGGKLSTGKILTKEDFDWFKTTVINSPQRKDTLSPVTNVYPSTVIYEGGKGSKQTDATSFDSSWFKNALALRDERIDSLSKVKHEDTSSKKSETDWKLYGLIALATIFFVDKAKNYLPFKIVRK